MLEHAWLIAALPLLSFLIVAFGAHRNRPLTAVTSIGGTALATAWSGTILAGMQAGGEFERNWRWLEAGEFRLDVGILIDPLAAVMLLVVCTVSLLVQIYSHGYMAEDEGYAKFFAYLSLFTAAMLGLVLSSNLFCTFIFWELVGLCSYLLIGFWSWRKDAASASNKAFLVNRIGDAGFLLAILLLARFADGAWEPGAFLGFSQLATVVPQLPSQIVTVIALLMFLGPVAKSAQFPLHVWLPDAMAGPTPISALIHAATMVAAGVYLLARVFPIVQASEMAMHTIAWVGAFTALFAATIALCQRDIKKALAYSTCSQLGYMVMSIGVGAWVAAIFHLVTHAFFKALLFLGSGSVIHGCHHEQDMSRYGGLARKMPVTASTFLIATMAISGVPGLSGFWSKERIIEATHFYPVVYWIAIGVAFLTALYMFRIYFLTFAGSYRGDDESHVHESPPSMTVPLVILALPSALLGLLGAGGDLFGNFLGHGHHVSFLEMLLAPAAWLALAGILVAWLIYARGGSVPVIGPLHRFLRELWYVDRAYGWLLRKVIMPSFDALWRLIDKVLIDGGLAEFLVWLQRRGGGLLAQLQSGQSQTYLGVGLSFLIAVLAVMVFSLAQYQSALDALVARMSSQ